MTQEEFDNRVEEQIISTNDLYNEGVCNDRLINIYDYVQTVVDEEDKSWLYHIVANKEDDDITIIIEDDDPKLFWGIW